MQAFNYIHLYPKIFFRGKSQTDESSGPFYATPVLHAYHPFSWAHTAKIISQSKPNYLIYSHWHPIFAPSTTQIISSVRKVHPETKIIGLFHNIAPHEYFPFQHFLIDSLISKTNFPIVLSNQTMNEFSDLYPDKKPVKLFHPVYEQKIPSKSKTETRKALGFKDDETILIFFGLVRKYKGLDILIDALNETELKEHRIRILIIGEFYLNPHSFISRIKENNRDQFTIINRFVSDSEAADYLHLSDAMILPYRSASQSGVLTNAINFELPVIVSNLPGLTEFIRHGENGLIFENGNKRALLDNILRITDVKLIKHLSNSMNKLKKRLTWEEFTSQLIQETECVNR